jgi:hypothetical protein
LIGRTGIVTAAGRYRATARFVVLVATLATAGCGAAGTLSAAQAPTALATTSSATTAGNRQAATAELQNLMSRLRVPAGAQRLARSPITYLDQAPVSIGSPTFESLTEWWTVDEPMADTETWLQAHPPMGLAKSGGGSAGGPMVPDNTFLEYGAAGTHSYGAPGLLIEVADVGGATTDIRVDAQDVWLPARSPHEVIALGTHVTLLADSGFPASSHPLFTKLLDTADGDALIADLDTLPTDDGGARGCGLDDGYRVIAIAIVDGTPDMFNDNTACAEVLVTRAGHSLALLDTNPAFDAVVLHLAGAPPPIT